MWATMLPIDVAKTRSASLMLTHLGQSLPQVYKAPSLLLCGSQGSLLTSRSQLELNLLAMACHGKEWNCLPCCIADVWAG